MNALIEAYLRSTGVRYFRGHHDDEYFFLVDFVFLVDAHQGRLHVHLEACGPERDSVQLSITPDRFYPVENRSRLSALAARWIGQNHGAEAVVHDSSDPSLVGVSVQSRHRPADAESLACFVDECVASAIELFGTMGQTVTCQPAAPELRNAG
jgi:hypothetical protein